MESLWDDAEAATYVTDLQQRVYTSRLLGRGPSLVLHGGGNTSVKITEPNIFGEPEEILYVKGSGWDLATIEGAGFTPIRLKHLQRLAQIDSLSDLQMVNEMKTHQTNAAAPSGSVEAILHACLPFKFVDHTHADAIITISNTPQGEQRLRELFGDEIIYIPYIMPGFDLARLVAFEYEKQATPNTKGMVLLNHGMFSFADTARESYERMIDFVNRAELYLQQHEAWQIADDELTMACPVEREQLAELRSAISATAGNAMLLRTDHSVASLNFCKHDDLEKIAQQGPATPDHVIRTKRMPLIGTDVAAYAENYREYFNTHAPNARSAVSMLDPAPRIILDKHLGMITIGKTAKEASINADIYLHTMQIIQRAEMLEQWQALPAQHIFDVEYWELEQAKLRKGGGKPEFQGEIALVTGAASGIGKACVDSLLQRGAAVVGLDLNPDIGKLYDRPDFLGLQCDVTDAEAVEQALDQAVQAFGGLDMLILNAGMFPGGTPIAELQDDAWRKVMEVNLDANLRLMRLCHPLLKLAPNNGRVVVIGSRNLLAPGPGAAAYSASKAALNQVARIAALEWGPDGIRINSLHPDAVFDTGLWTEEVLNERAAYYGMSVEAYKTRNVLRTEIRSHDVAELAAAMCGSLFAKTTAAGVPVDGGNDRVI
ncbi:MAG: bifunctional aldolase/short-chain dehydrogenase [Chromatiales bacterium]|jgi:rhamnose utilization protein RhaD (predicted bifunctional aldolase and dehydrogenase)/NAD(P)-dependent dehydrogenase (short-subunit alcohol dehydrogenase family)